MVVINRWRFFLDLTLLLPIFFWLGLAIYDISRLGIETKMKFTPLPVIIHAISTIGICFNYFFIFFGSNIKNSIFKFVVASLMALLFMATYEFFYWLFLINNLDYDLRKLEKFLKIYNFLGHFPRVIGVNLKFFFYSIIVLIIVFLLLKVLNYYLNFLKFNNTRIVIFIFFFLFFLSIMTYLFHQGFFILTYFWFTGQTSYNPHNWLWALSKITSSFLFWPFIKLKNEK